MMPSATVGTMPVRSGSTTAVVNGRDGLTFTVTGWLMSKMAKDARSAW
jgi:hypothetical protein